MKPKILLTGPSGQIGYELHRALPQLGDVFALGHRQLDLDDPGQIANVVGEVQPDIVVNAAGYTAVDKAESEPDTAYRINRDGTAALALAAKHAGALLVHYSTDYVFDGLRDTPYPPDHDAQPINLYGMSKYLGEQAMHESGVHGLILRTSWVYSTRRTNFLLSILRQAHRQTELSVVDDQFGSPTPAHVIAEATVEALRTMLAEDRTSTLSSNVEVHHLCCGGRTTWHGFAAEIVRLAQLPSPPRITAVSSDTYETAATRPRYSVLDCSSFEDRFGVELPDWKAALNDLAHSGLPGPDAVSAMNRLQGGGQ